MPAKIRINSERTHAEFITPEGDEFTERVDTLTVLGDVEEDSTVYVGVAGDFPCLKSNTIYKLVPIATTLEENVLIEFVDEESEEIEDDEDDESEEEDEDETLPVK